MADEPQIPKNDQSEALPQSERVFRMIVIIGAIVIAIVLLAFGAYLAITVLGPQATPTPQADVSETEVPELEATATAACKVFLEEFPGTPCPE